MLALLFALVVAVFAVQNAGLVLVGFLHWKFEISLALVILGSTAAGALVVFLLGVVQQVGRGMKMREYRSEIRRLNAELEARQKEVGEVAFTKEECGGTGEQG